MLYLNDSIFFLKGKELDGLVAREDGSEKRILPVWHNVGRKEVVTFSPPLADKLGVAGARVEKWRQRRSRCAHRR